MNRSNYRGIWPGMLVVAVTLAAPAEAGEFQIGARLGRDTIEIDGNRLSSGESVDDHLVNAGLSVSYRWDPGAFVEAGISGSASVDIININSLTHHWLGAGWQYELNARTRFTPKAGLTYTELHSSVEDLFDSEPMDKFTDWVPFVELSLERRFGRHMGMGLYLRHTFEEWGSTQDFGLALRYTFL